MNQINLKYQLDEVPPRKDLILLGLQWLVITIPIIIIIGKVVAGIHFDDPLAQTVYVQRLFFVMAITALAQIFFGHGLPLIVGPASVLLVGILSNQATDIGVIYGSIAIGGGVLALVSLTGIFGRLKKIFTPRVVASTLILIAFTLTPMMIDLLATTSAQGSTGFSNLLFSLGIIFAMFIANRFSKGIWKSTLNIWAILIGTVGYNVFFPPAAAGPVEYPLVSNLFAGLQPNLAVDPGILISFLVCFLALSINDLGSIQSLNEVIHADRGERRVTRGIAVTGLGNALAGVFGVVGPVNLSLSPGVIVSTRCASRFTLVPMGLGLLAISFFPGAIAFMGGIPAPVIGSVLVYIMCSQIAAGLMIAFNSPERFTFDHGLVIGLSLMLSIMISFLPQEVVNTLPVLLRPILGNGFVVGVLSALLMDQLILRRETGKAS